MFSSLTERRRGPRSMPSFAGANDYAAKPAGLDPAAVTAVIRGELAAKIKGAVPRGGLVGGGMPCCRRSVARRLRPAWRCRRW